jgi:GT2 family glycosyltransferase
MLALLDGQPVATLTPQPIGAEMRVPVAGERLPGFLNFRDAATGAPLLAEPLRLASIIAPRVERAVVVAGGNLSLEVSLASRLLPRLRIRGMTADNVLAVDGIARPESAPGNHGRALYRIVLPLRSFAPAVSGAEVTLEIGGWRIEPAITIGTQQVNLVGYVERASQEAITGWAADLNDPDRRVQIAAQVGDRVLATVTADRPRPDLASLGIAATHCGFHFPTEAFGTVTDGEEISIVLAETHTNLINSPLRISVSATIRGLFDTIDGDSACGWVTDLSQPDVPCLVEALCENRVVGRATANGLRRDVLEAGWPTERCGFRIIFSEPLHSLLGKDIRVRVEGTPTFLNGGPLQPRLNPNEATYLAPDRGIAPAALTRLRGLIARRTEGGGVSLVMPIHNTKREWLIEALRSVCTQWCERWELICVDDASTEPQVAFVLNWFARTEPRIRVIHTPRNLGVAGATNLGIAAATLPLVALMDHDDVLEPDAVYHLVTAAKQTDADLIYSDEAITGEDIARILAVRARPAFSHDYYLSHPYFVHLVAVRRELAQRLGFDDELRISADVDFVLRVIEASRAVAHVPRVLYRWRTHGGSTGHAKRDEVMAATRAAIQRHLDRAQPGAVASAAPEFNQFEVAWPDPGGLVLIVIPTKDGVDVLRQCVESIERTIPPEAYRLVVIDHQSKEPRAKRYLAQLAERHIVMPYKGAFNYAAMNNLAVRTHGKGASFALLMNNDVEAIDSGWLQRLRSIAARPQVGAVGALLIYPDKRVQHAGVVVGINGLADHALRFDEVWEGDGQRALGYNASLTALRDFSAVTAACLMLRMSVFEEVGGFDETFAVGFNDTDLCLRIGRAGYKILYDGRTILYHHESVTRIARSALKHPKDDQRLRDEWNTLLRDGDPYYNPALELVGRDHRLREGRCGPVKPRVVRLRSQAAVEPPKAKPRRKTRV